MIVSAKGTIVEDIFSMYWLINACRKHWSPTSFSCSKKHNCLHHVPVRHAFTNTTIVCLFRASGSLYTLRAALLVSREPPMSHSKAKVTVAEFQARLDEQVRLKVAMASSAAVAKAPTNKGSWRDSVKIKLAQSGIKGFTNHHATPIIKDAAAEARAEAHRRRVVHALDFIKRNVGPDELQFYAAQVLQQTVGRRHNEGKLDSIVVVQLNDIKALTQSMLSDVFLQKSTCKKGITFDTSPRSTSSSSTETRVAVPPSQPDISPVALNKDFEGELLLARAMEQDPDGVCMMRMECRDQHLNHEQFLEQLQKAGF